MTLDLDSGLTSVIGPNGGGKSTFLQLINGLMSPTAGTVTVNGADVRREPKTVRRNVGFVFSDPAAQLVMPTVIEDLELSLRTTVKRERRARAMAVLESFGIADLASRSIYELSGGQRQLVAIASVMATRPQVLILDEPTTLLDLANTQLIRHTVTRLVSGGTQVIFSTHDLDFAADADDCVCIAQGAVAAHGGPHEVVAQYRSGVMDGTGTSAVASCAAGGGDASGADAAGVSDGTPDTDASEIGPNA